MLLLNRFRIVLIRGGFGLLAICGVAGVVFAYHYLHTTSRSGDAVADVPNAIEAPQSPDADVTSPHPPTEQAFERARQLLASMLERNTSLANLPGPDLRSAPDEQADELLIFGEFNNLVAACESCGPHPVFDDAQPDRMGYMGAPWPPSGMFIGRSSSGERAGASGAGGGSGGSGGVPGGGGASETKGTASQTSSSLPQGGSGDDETDENPDQTPKTNGPTNDIDHTWNGPSDKTPNDRETGSNPNGAPQRPVSVPEPSTLMLAGFGLSGLAATRRWRRGIR